MGREANFSELRDAIRQGQAKIAQGLKTGQMRSDREKEVSSPRPRLDPAHEVLGKKPVVPQKQKTTLFEPPRKPAFRFRMPSLPKIRLPKISLPPLRPALLGMLAVLAVALVVFLIYSIGAYFVGLVSSRSPVEEPVVAVQPVEPAVQRPEPQVSPAVQPTAEPVRPTPGPVSPPAQTGNNVIVIQYITSSRENELLPVRDFFAKNGVATEILRRGSGSYLVTRDRFENPNRTDTDGYAMLLKIRAIGKRYPVETGDRQFGTEPFQDAYGMLRQ